MGILELKNLSLEFEDKKILNNLNLDFREGHIHAIVGPNGAGKSTLAYTIMGLSDYRDISGEIFFKDESIHNIDIDERARKGITLAWQEPARFEGLSTKKFLKAAAKDKSEENLRNALLSVGLSPDNYIDRAVDKTLSGGERKRIELASIYIMEPELVLLDEPDSGIDVAALEKIFEMIKVLKKRKTTVILITHSLTVLEQAEYAFLMCNGKIVDKGSVNKIAGYFRKKCVLCDHKNKPEPDVFEME
ncbi:MAG: ABC transporter ATP-binding protein [Candidatus Eremiobacteraeota bacterium]|nr:ABC transporter ATP-binding protein [Candidatus Eremiobacteraeota bacterium]